MQILEFGSKNKPMIVLIHGFESPHQVFDEYIDYYKDEYHIIVPILPGHNPKLKEEVKSLDLIVFEIEKYILQYTDKVDVIYGMSMGGIFACRILENDKIQIKKMILDGSPLLGFGKIPKKVFVKTYLTLTHKTQKRDIITLEKVINEMIPQDKLEYLFATVDSISDETIVKYIDIMDSYRLPIIKSDTFIYYFYGDKINETLSKKVAKFLKKNYENCKIISFKNKGHCEVSVFTPKKMIEEFIKNNII